MLLLTALALITLHGLERQAGQILHPQAMAAVPGPAGDGVQTDVADAHALAALERAVARLTQPGEPIFVADPRHDVVHVGDPLLYVILDHPNPTRYDVMQPGLITTASVQREIITSLERSRTRVVIRWLDPRAYSPASTTAQTPRATCTCSTATWPRTSGRSRATASTSSSRARDERTARRPARGCDRRGVDPTDRVWTFAAPPLLAFGVNAPG